MDPDVLNEYDRALVVQLRAIGVADAWPAEHAFKGSNVAGTDGGRFVNVSTSHQDLEYDGRVLRTLDFEGIELRIFKFFRSLRAVHFTCHDVDYDVRKWAGSDGGDPAIDASIELAQRLIASLDCS